MREFTVVDHILKEREIEGVEFTPLQKELIFKEINFRLKNNLNTIASLFGLQILNAKAAQNNEISKVLQTNKVRINAISLLHDCLCKKSEGSSFSDHLQKIVELINDDLSQLPNLVIDFDDIKLSSESIIRLGTIFCELYTNSLQYACDDSCGCDEIIVSLKSFEDKFVFTYFEKNHIAVDIKKIEKSTTVGIKLIKINSRQLKAKLDIFNKEGLVFQITIPQKDR